ncbi:MAG: TolC family protein [Gammaproteobacteria bacterium]|nr:TolC family protein [Gammaproteobacteria bacterium]
MILLKQGLGVFPRQQMMQGAMAMVPSRVLMAGGILLLLVVQARAETLNFRRSVDLALKQNPAMALSQARVGQAQGGVRQARGGLLPSLTGSFNATRSNDTLNVFGFKLAQRRATFNDFGAGQFNPNDLGIAPGNLNYPGAYNNYDTRLQLDVPIYNGGMSWGRVAEARAYLRAARRGDRAARQQLIFGVLQAYEGVRLARAYVGVAHEAERAAGSYVRTTQQLFNKGVVVKSDLLSAQVHLEDVRLQLQQAQDQQATALDQFHVLLGLPVTSGADVGPEVTPPPSGQSLSEMQRQALVRNPQIATLRARLKATQAGINVARAGYLPHVNVMLRRDWNKPTPGLGASSYTVAGVLSWELLDFGTRGGAVDEANARRLEAVARVRQAEDQLLVQIAKTWRAARAATRRVTAEKLAVQQAEEAQRLIALRYQGGVATLSELLSGQARLDKARAELVKARYEQAVQRAALLLATGRLDLDRLTAGDGTARPGHEGDGHS